MNLKPSARALSLLLLLAALSQAPAAQQTPAPQHQADLGAFIKEIMIIKKEGSQNQLVLWLPYEFFAEAVLSQGGKDRATVDKEIGFLRPYVIVVVQRGADQPDGKTVYVGEADVRSRAALVASDGTEIAPLDKPPPLVSATVAAFKSVITAEGDAGSANMHVLVFPNTTKQGAPLVNAQRQDKLTLLLKPDRKFTEGRFVWHTPFDALRGSTECARCKAGLSAKWSYCPYCGQKISP